MSSADVKLQIRHRNARLALTGRLVGPILRPRLVFDRGVAQFGSAHGSGP